ncbi:MAG: Crp/Fnr family transcriptional regulator [Lacipirellulaceae bacterium]
MTEELWYLKQCELFRRITPGEAVRIEPRCRTKTFKRGEPVYLPADAADAVLVVATGRVKIGALTPDGKQSILAFIEPGEMFGELSALDGAPREEFAEAAERSTIVLLPADVLRELVERNPLVAAGVTKLIGLRRRRVERRLRSLLYRSNRQRLLSLLAELAEAYGDPAPEVGPRAVRLRIRLSHQDIASVIGSTRETVTVTLGELAAEGLVEVGRRRLVLTDVELLASSGEPNRSAASDSTTP